MKKVLLIIGIVLVLLIGSIVAIPFLFKDDLIALVKEEANKNLNAKVDFGEFDLTIIKSFPNLTFIIEDVIVDGVEEFEGIRLAQIGKMETTLDIMSVINGETMNIKAFHLYDSKLHAKILPSGKANWDIAKPSEEPETPEAETESKFHVQLKKYSFENIDLTYEDDSSDMHTYIVGFTHIGEGDFTQDNFLLKTITTMKEMTFDMEGLTYINKANMEFKADLEMDMVNSKYTFIENTFRINELVLAFDGWLSMPNETDMDMDLKFSAPSTNFKDVLSLVPAVYMTDFKDIETAGEFNFSGFAKGIYNEKNLPAFDLTFNVNNARFKYPDLPKSVENIQIASRITNLGGSDDNTIIDVSQFHLEMGENPVDIKLNVKTPISDPDMMCEIKTQLNLDNMGDFIPMEEGEEYHGNITADINLKGRMSSLDNERYDEFVFNGELIVLDMLYKSKDLPYSVDLKKMYVKFDPKMVELSSFESMIGKTDIAMSGRVDNFLEYYMKDTTLKGSFTLTSNFMDLNELMGPDEPEDTTAAAEEEGAAEVPANIDFVLNTNIKKMLYDNMTIENMNGGVTIKDQVMAMNNLKMDMMKGALIMNGSYETKDITSPSFDFDMNISKWDLPMTFATFNTIQKLAPIAENAKGAISTTLKMAGKLDTKMEPVMNSLTGNGSLLTHEVLIESSGTLTKLADALKKDEYKKLSLNNIKILYEFLDGRLHVKPFDLKVASSTVNFSGSHGFDETMDYLAKMTVPRSEFGGAANNMLDGLLSQANAAAGTDVKLGDNVKLDVFITGTLTDPKVNVGLQGHSDGMKQSLQDQAKQQIEAAKEVVIEKAKEEVGKVVDDTKEKAKAEADKILEDARKQAEVIKQQAKVAADKAKEEGYAQATKVEKEAKNPIEKAAAKIAADKIRKEADAQSAKIIAEGDKQAQAVINEAQKRADELTK